MKRLIFIITIVAGLYTGTRAADGDLFPYPVPPEDMVMLTERCDYLVSHFWDRCNFKAAFSTREKLNNTFGDWVSFMPYATADTVHAAIDRLLGSLAKSGPQTLAIARMAEGWLYSDTTDIYSEEVYYPFAKAVVEHRKIDRADKARFATQMQIIDNTRVGQKVGHLNYRTVDGEPHSLDETRSQMIIVFFTEHTCDACTLARIRLAADINATAMIRAGMLSVICIEPGEMTEEWRQAAANYPTDWINGISDDAADYFPLRTRASFLLLDSRHKLLAKDFDIDGLLAALATLRINSGL